VAIVRLDVRFSWREDLHENEFREVQAVCNVINCHLVEGLGALARGLIIEVTLEDMQALSRRVTNGLTCSSVFRTHE